VEVTESGLKLIVWVVAASVLGTMLAVPQPVDPWEMPSLVLDRAAASDAISLDETLAKEAPKSEEAEALRALFLDHGRSEANLPYERSVYDQRQVAIHHAMASLVEKHGAQAIAAMRAEALETFVRVFADGRREPQGDVEIAVLGGAVEILKRYGAMHRGVLVAPPLTARVFYKARWNAVHRRPLIDGFSDVELQAYWGWLALHGWGKTLYEREEALLAFRDAGGVGTEEAAALFDLLAGQPNRASKSLEKLYLASGELRLRNLALGAGHAALLPMGGP
jgi:hypothetical protein